MKTHWKLSENAWEYWGDIYITSKEMPTVKKVSNGDYKMNVDGITIKFDEEIRFVKIVEESGEQNAR